MLIFSNFNLYQDDKINNPTNEGELDNLLLSSNTNLDEKINGSGVDQDVRIYVNNISENLNDNLEYFEIPSLPSEDMVLTYGDFNFTFQNNFTTEYIIEDDDALYANDFISFDYNTTYSGITFNNGTIKGGGYAQLIDDNLNSYIYINATKGLLNFTITANFTNTIHYIEFKGNLKFNRSKILALISSLVFTLFDDANLTVRIKDFSQPTWIEVVSTLPVNSSLGRQEFREHFINENLNYINLSNVCEIEFVFERYEPFEAYINEYDLQSTYAFDLPITNQSYVALEFDLKGKESAVHGFYGWIRTLDRVEATSTQLNITLYRANSTVVRTDYNLINVNLGPDYYDRIDSIIVDSYTGDNYSYFKFNIGNTDKLNLSNYFIVIKSNNSKEVYSLVTLPNFDYGDDLETEHQLKTTLDDGKNWTNAKEVIDYSLSQYESGQLDASLFILNVTRGYMPSDFNMSGNYNLTIQNLPILDYEISSYPYNESSYLTWGIGQWIHNFSIPIEDDPSNNFRVNLTWNKTNIKGFKFNVSYSVNAYWIENASTAYSVNYDSNPEWIFNYTKDSSNPNFNYWDFYEFWFVYPDFLNAQNLTKPNGQEIFWQLSGESPLAGDSSKYKVIVPESLADIDDIYSLNLTSYNFIHDMHSYINYNGILWETNGFMYGDNISISLEIQDHNLKAPNSGNANVTLFFPNGSKYVPYEQISSTGTIKDSTLIYDFDNHTILNLTSSLTVFGKYHLGFFWSKGSAIGCKEIIIYIDAYDLDLYGCEYYPELDSNVISGYFKKDKQVFDNYTILIASVNETTSISMPNFYPINNTDVNSLFLYKVGGQQLPVMITSYKQSEDIINPSESVKINVTLQNLHAFISVSVKVNVKLVSYANEEWIIAENTTDPVLLYFSGHQDESNEFSLDLNIPYLDNLSKVWAGINAPIRLGGAKTFITLYIDDVDIGTYELPEISLLSNETKENFEGNILGLRVTEEATTSGILYEFQRDECLYYPKNISFLVNVIDQNYVSSYKQFSNEFSLNLNSIFTDISINPSNPVKGQIINVTSILTTEFEDELINKNVTCQYYDTNLWVTIGSDLTDSNGLTSFLINTQKIDFEGDLLVRLIWSGDVVNEVSKNISINIIHQSNNISISINKNDVQVYKNRETTFTITLVNIGDSNLRVFNNFSIELNYEFSYSIVQIDYLSLDWFSPGEKTNLIIEIDIGAINNLNISISIFAQNIITNESIRSTAETSFKIYEPPIYDYFIEYFMFIFIAVFAVIWIVVIIYMQKIRKRIATPIEEPTKRRPRREKYVPVSELKKPTPIKKPLKKSEEPKEVKEKKTMDLDSLLEERGLGDKKKKPKK